MFIRQRIAGLCAVQVLGCLLVALSPMTGEAGQRYQIYVSNEKSGDLTVIDGSDNRVLDTIPVGKRPRGIHASPDGKSVYVALSGTPVAAPPQLDAKGNPIFKGARTTMMTTSRLISRPMPSASWTLRPGN